MPRAKRILAETDSNAEVVVPRAKRTSTGKAPEKGNDAPLAAKKGGKATTTKQASTKGKKSIAKKLEPKDVSSTTTGSEKAPTSKEPRSKPAKSATVSKSTTVPDDADRSTWICICRPPDDAARELGTDLYSKKGAKLVTCGGPKCMCKKPADEHPEHKWIATKAGFELLLKWMDELSNRDQDNFDMYIYNDFTGYGTMEVMENMLVSFDKEFKKSVKKGDPVEMVLPLWSQVEAIGFFLNAEFEMCLCDDAEGIARLVMTMGVALLATISLLIKHDLFKDGNPVIRNLGLVLSNFLFSDACHEDLCNCNEYGWSGIVVQLADKHDVTIKGVSGIDTSGVAARAPALEDRDEGSGAGKVAPTKTKGKSKKAWKLEDDYDDAGERVWKRWDWGTEFAEYSARGRFVPHGGNGGSARTGGKEYDLTNKTTMARAKKWSERYEMGSF